MGYLEALPEELRQFIRTRSFTEYATVSGAGVPIDTPTFVFPAADLSTIDVATGLAYPAKADRARRNPKVGLTLQGTVNEPVISIAGRAAVRDADLQANLDRYLRETIVTAVISPEVNDWDERVRPAIHYLTRVIVEVMPAHVRWWPNHAAMDGPPEEWRAPTDTIFPQSDPAPSGKPSAAPNWGQPDWRELARSALATGWSCALTLCDDTGYPLPFLAREVSATDDGFRLVMPRAVPWRSGKATVSFMGWNVFVGDAEFVDGAHLVRVERALPVLPLTKADGDVLKPEPDALERLMERLRFEADRRRQPIPTAPATPPSPTPLAEMRAKALADWNPTTGYEEA